MSGTPGDSLTPEQRRPPPWIAEAAEAIYDQISNRAILGMLDGDEDPGDTPLYLLRRQQVLIGLQCSIEANERARNA